MGTESAIGCLVFSLVLTFLFSRSLPCSKQLFKSICIDSWPQIWLQIERNPVGKWCFEKVDKLVGQLGLLWLRPGVACAGGGGVWGFSAWCGVQWCVVHGVVWPVFHTLEKLLWARQTSGKQKKWAREKKPSSLSQTRCQCASVALTGTKFDPQTAEK